MEQEELIILCSLEGKLSQKPWKKNWQLSKIKGVSIQWPKNFTPKLIDNKGCACVCACTHMCLSGEEIETFMTGEWINV